MKTASIVILSIMPGFHHSLAVLLLPFCRCKIPLLCKNYVRKFRSVTALDSKKIRNGSGNGNGVWKRERRNGNGRTATEWWKPGITCPSDVHD